MMLSRVKPASCINIVSTAIPIARRSSGLTNRECSYIKRMRGFARVLLAVWYISIEYRSNTGISAAAALGVLSSISAQPKAQEAMFSALRGIPFFLVGGANQYNLAFSVRRSALFMSGTMAISTRLDKIYSLNAKKLLSTKSAGVRAFPRANKNPTSIIF
ncbi:hypothetical protein XBKB1_1560013 [Xenorhabdus bovienii str. kraussei Becker Underwood]|uniref:Uncharacterized protein n=1 Tax=Xenorhabdus bovienii str. kraussei Becker Underwood TaxID=1398204 RepID=A0A077PTN9_XENBV|nr:hypothetical protein XBKB1_1560013 [Xenorhabdus bovienii str. kraussei Becker Underwood]